MINTNQVKKKKIKKWINKKKINIIYKYFFLEDIEYDELVNAYENDDYEEVDAEYDELYKKVEHEGKIY